MEKVTRNVELEVLATQNGRADRRPAGLEKN